jgi:Periplasmic component of the Tol biopolymer transport system
MFPKKFRYSFLSITLILSALNLFKGSEASVPTDTLRRVTNTAEEKINLNPSLSGDGRHVAFESSADLAANGGTNSFRAFRAALATEPATFTQLGPTRAISPAISQDGSIIAYASKENPLGTNPDGNSEIFLYSSGQLRQITNTLPGDIELRHVNGNFQPSLTDNGTIIAFSSNRQLTGQNADENLEIFLFHTATENFEQLTNTIGMNGATDAKISGDGSRIAFIKDESDAPTNARDLIVRDLQSGDTRVVADNINKLSLTYGRAISDDGLRVVYSSETAANTTQLFLYDGRNNLTRQLTSLGARADDVPLNATISGDGKRIAFATRRNVIGGNSDNSAELYTFDLPTLKFARVTNAPSSATAEVVSSLNDEGTVIAFNFPRVLSGTVSSPNLANNSEIYFATTEVRPPFSANLIIQNGATFGHEPHSLKAVAPDSIAVAFGQVIAFTTAQAHALPDGTFPTVLAGTTVKVNDQPAQILSISPTRVSFHVPENIAHSFAQVTVTNSEGFETRGTIRVLPAAPGIFTSTADGLGEGVILDALTGQPGPFDPTSEPRSLVVYATGARQLGSQTFLTIAGRHLPFESINANTQTPGLDEIRFKLPRDLRGAGTVSMSLRAGRRESNPVTLKIAGDFGREVFINEALADPPDGLAGDANHDGVRSGADDEFIELVNAQTEEVNISGWTLRTRAIGSTNEITRHIFATGTIIQARDALVIFGGGNFNPTHPSFGGSQILAASTGGVSLTNTGMTILLRDAAGHLITEFTYGPTTGLDGNANQSLTRSPDISGAYMLHTQATGAQGRPYSPGTMTDNTFFVHHQGHLTSVNLAPASSDAFVGQRVQFTARGFDQFNRPMRFLQFSFSSTNQNVATIESMRIDRLTGKVTATLLCRHEGATEIRATATDGNTSLTTSASTLNVKPAPPVIVRIEVSPASSTINRGSSQQLTATAFDANNQIITGVPFNWTSNSPAIATVDGNGLVRGTGTGNANIIATAPNGTGGSISGQASITVSVSLIINEILADVPPDVVGTTAVEGDANRDGVRDAAADEFIELINNSAQSVDISGVIIADATSNRYTFPPQTILPAGRSVIVFGGGAPPVNDAAFGGSLVMTASSLGLNDTGDTVHLKLPVAGTEISLSTITFGASGPIPAPSNQSLTRSPDAEINQAGGNFIAHLNATDAAGRVFSPGTRAAGTPFGSAQIIRLEIAPSVASINIGEMQTFSARAFVNHGGSEFELQNVCFIWDSSDASKAVLAPQTGASTVATGIAAGTVTVRARAGNQEATATLTINPPPQVLTRIEVLPQSAAIIVGGTRQFNARGFDQNDMEINGLVFNWTSSNESAATINQNGLATGISAGTTQITASSAQVTSPPATLTVTVPQVPTAGQVIINEALVSFTSGTPTRTDFVELYNTTNQTLDISGLIISFRASGNTSTVSTVTLPGSVGSGMTLISPNSYFLIANGPTTFGVLADFNASGNGFDINNSSGAVLIQVNALKLDGLRYQQNGSAVPPVAFDNFGEGTLFTFAGGTPNDLVRSPNATDTNNNATDFRRNNSHATVSPKAANPTLP